jgi:glycine dehydrogenase subunit 1
MTTHEATAHPYMANSVPETKAAMLAAIGVADIEDLFEAIPERDRTTRPFELPPAIVSEAALRRHVSDLLNQNLHAGRVLSFLGAGCWPHHVPAVCDEIAARSEFVTNVWGTPSSDLGRNQAWFEFASQLGDLLEMDFVGLPVYSWGCASGHAIRMAARMTGRNRVLVPASIDPQRLSVIRTYCQLPGTDNAIDVVLVAVDEASGQLSLADLSAKLDHDAAAVYVESPNHLGMIEKGLEEACAQARAAGALSIVGVDPLSLGLLAPPGQYGADIATGPTQPLGIHMNGGGGTGGFIATPDEERFATQYPTLQVTMVPTRVPGERGFALTLFEQSSYGSREDGNDWTGNSVYLWAVVNAVYMSLLGPSGFRELGEQIMANSHDAARKIAAIPGIEVPYQTGFFKEFVVSYNATGLTVAEVNRRLQELGIWGGADLSETHPWLGQSALVCVTEVHTDDDIDRLVDALTEVTVS